MSARTTRDRSWLAQVMGSLSCYLGVWALAVAWGGSSHALAQETPVRSAFCANCASWPLWEEFKEHHLDASGRVRDDPEHDAKTVSEGQAYGLFFALVAGDRAAFERILAWSNAHLAQGELGEHLMSWHWGQSPDGSWRVLDSNAATDADLWMAFTLLEAARLWAVPEWQALGLRLAARLSHEATTYAPGLGRVLLPGTRGFVHPPQRWMLNPSYYPPPVMQHLARAFANDDWSEIAVTARHTLQDTLLKFKYPPDWVLWDSEQGWQVSPPQEGSYDAIRVYLWIALSSASDRQALCPATQPWLAWIDLHGLTPERWPASDSHNEPSDHVTEAGTGFDAVALALAHACGQAALAQKLEQRFCQRWAQAPRGYYQRALALFSTGWLEQRFSFDPQAHVVIRQAMPGTPPSASGNALCRSTLTALPALD